MYPIVTSSDPFSTSSRISWRLRQTLPEVFELFHAYVGVDDQIDPELSVGGVVGRLDAIPDRTLPGSTERAPHSSSPAAFTITTCVTTAEARASASGSSVANACSFAAAAGLLSMGPGATGVPAVTMGLAGSPPIAGCANDDQDHGLSREPHRALLPSCPRPDSRACANGSVTIGPVRRPSPQDASPYTTLP